MQTTVDKLLVDYANCARISHALLASNLHHQPPRRAPIQSSAYGNYSNILKAHSKTFDKMFISYSFGDKPASVANMSTQNLSKRKNGKHMSVNSSSRMRLQAGSPFRQS